MLDVQEDAYINAGAHANLLGILGVGAKVDLHPAHPRINTGLFGELCCQNKWDFTIMKIHNITFTSLNLVKLLHFLK